MSTDKFLTTHKIFCGKKHDFENMVHFLVKRSHSYNLPRVFLNITPKPYMT